MIGRSVPSVAPKGLFGLAVLKDGKNWRAPYCADSRRLISSSAYSSVDAVRSKPAVAKTLVRLTGLRIEARA